MTQRATATRAVIDCVLDADELGGVALAPMEEPEVALLGGTRASREMSVEEVGDVVDVVTVVLTGLVE